MSAKKQVKNEIRTEENRRLAEWVEPFSEIKQWIEDPAHMVYVSPLGAWIKYGNGVFGPVDFFASEPANALLLERLLWKGWTVNWSADEYVLYHDNTKQVIWHFYRKTCIAMAVLQGMV